MYHTDQLNNTLELPHQPKRIISLVPSQTELLYDLGLDTEVLGITKFCVHPAHWFRSKTRVGGTKQYHFDRIAALRPDLIIGNKEENEQVQIERLAEQYPVWMSDIYTLNDAFEMMEGIGKLVGKVAAANDLVQQTKIAFEHLAYSTGLRVAYFIWRKPYMVAAKNTFIDEMLKVCGFENCFAEQVRYPEISLSDIVTLAPDCIFLSSEPYPFKAAHISEIQAVLPKAHIQLVDGEAFSWYGSRLLKSVPYLQSLKKI